MSPQVVEFSPTGGFGFGPISCLKAPFEALALAPGNRRRNRRLGLGLGSSTTHPEGVKGLPRSDQWPFGGLEKMLPTLNNKFGLVTSTEQLNLRTGALGHPMRQFLAGPQACFVALSLSQSRPLPPLRPRPLLAGRCWLDWTLQATLPKHPYGRLGSTS